MCLKPGCFGCLRFFWGRVLCLYSGIDSGIDSVLDSINWSSLCVGIDWIAFVSPKLASDSLMIDSGLPCPLSSNAIAAFIRELLEYGLSRGFPSSSVLVTICPSRLMLSLVHCWHNSAIVIPCAMITFDCPPLYRLASNPFLNPGTCDIAFPIASYSATLPDSIPASNPFHLLYESAGDKIG